MKRSGVLSLIFLFLANSVSSETQKEAQESVVRVSAGAPLSLECGLRAEQRAEWRRDGAPIPPGLHAEPEQASADGRLRARLRATEARLNHAGLYTCTPEREQRVRVLVDAAPLGQPGEATAPAAGVEGGADEVVYEVRSNITLRCPLTGDGAAFAWSKNGTALDEVWEMKDRYRLEAAGGELHVQRALEDDFGNYSCAVGGAAHVWAVRARPHLKLPANTNVVEGQKFKVTCKVLGKPYPRVHWSFTNATEGEANWTEVEGGAFADSEQGVPDGTLVVEEARREHAGRYRCAAGDAAPAETLLRVKDKYAALWPFLGICAEVFVLCAIILVYEKRRVKPDLDDSDTDNHDQKKS